MATFHQLQKISQFIHARPALAKIAIPFSKAWVELSGFKKMGLKASDLIIEENDVVQKALHRIPAKESYLRSYRIATAAQLSLSHKILPKNEILANDQQKTSLLHYILQAEKEEAERKELDNIVPTGKKGFE